MKTEQKDLNQRISFEFLSQEDWDLVDHDLIKECDDNAADIEATFFDVKDYEKHELASCKANKTVIHDDFFDRLLFQRIISSRFNQNTICAGSVGVQLFANCLQDIQSGIGSRYQAEMTLSIFKAYGFMEF